MTGKNRILCAVLPAMVLPFIASIFYFVLFSESIITRTIYVSIKLFMVAWPLFSICLITRVKFPSIQTTFKKQLKAALTGILVAMPLIALMAILMLTSLEQVIAGSSNKIAIKAEQFGMLEHYWMFAIFLSLIHSFIEEYYWRWFVFGKLQKVTGILTAYILTGVAFGSHHVVIGTQFFGLFWGFIGGLLVAAAGIIWSIMYHSQKTIIGAWVCHLIVDLYIMSIGYKLILAHS
jgi:membrane protease YdiL (CAAX protease family)